MKLISKKPVFNKEYFLFLLPLFFVFHGFTENFPLVQIKEIIGLAGYYIILILLISFISFIIFKSWRKASVFTFFIFTFHFLFGSAHDLVKQVFNEGIITRYVFILPSVIIAFIFLFFFIKRTHRKFNRLTNYANVLFIVLILFDAVQLFLKANNNAESTVNTEISTKICDTCSKPDIYFIIADEYAGNRALKQLFNFDNTVFQNELRTRGFHVIDSSNSNYNYTFFSVASMIICFASSRVI